MDKQKQVLILPGDGIGPEVCDEAKKVLIHVNQSHDLNKLFSKIIEAEKNKEYNQCKDLYLEAYNHTKLRSFYIGYERMINLLKS